MSRETLLKWAEENERLAADYRIIARTDPARYSPATEAAKRRDQIANEYRKAANRQ